MLIGVDRDCPRGIYSPHGDWTPPPPVVRALGAGPDGGGH